MAKKTIWFPAKRYGWGWGPPIAWQGWLVLGFYFLLVTMAAVILLPSKQASETDTRVDLMYFFGAVIVLSIGLIGVCYAKGEKPSWRWGNRGDEEW